MKQRSVSGKACLFWKDLENEMSTSIYFMDSIEEAKNYCRNPDGDVNGPWCYTSEENKETCLIEFCGRNILKLQNKFVETDRSLMFLI
jgi:hypothetical protein